MFNKIVVRVSSHLYVKIFCKETPTPGTYKLKIWLDDFLKYPDDSVIESIYDIDFSLLTKFGRLRPFNESFCISNNRRQLPEIRQQVQFIFNAFYCWLNE